MTEVTATGPLGVVADGLGWLPQSFRPLLDTLADAVVAVNTAGFVVYANPAAERLLGWPPGALVGNPVESFVPPGLIEEVEGGFPAFAEEVAGELAGTHLEISSLRRDGTEILTELMVTMIDDGLGNRIVLGTIRERMSEQFRRWSELTNQLLDTMVDGASTEATGPSEPTEQQLLADIGTHLGWDLTTLWTLSQSAELVCRHVWRDPSLDADSPLARARPVAAGSGVVTGATLPLHVLHSGETLWVPDLAASAEFSTGPAATAGFTSALVFPVRYQGDVVGVVELLSRIGKPFDPGVVDLLRAITDPLGHLLVAIEQAAEREALLAEVEAARRSQDFLLLATRVLAEASDFGATLDSLAEVAVPILADLCLIDVLDVNGELTRAACRHADPSKRSLVEELRHDFPPDPDGEHPSVDVVRLGRPRWSPDMSDEFLRRTTRNDRHYEVVKELGFTSYMVVPLIAKDQNLGALTLVSAGSGRRFSERDLLSAQQLADQVASVVERARRHEQDHTVSHMLQQSLLPDSLPVIAGLELVARYLPASDITEVGGDWYDAFAIGRRVALVIGDVEGHDMVAATVMGNLRIALKAFMIEDPVPATAIARLNRFVVASNITRLSTVLVAVVDPVTGSIVAASAGHPPPIVTDGEHATLLDVTPGPPIGIADATYPETSATIAGRTVICYTDGLIEDRTHSIDEGIETLLAVVLEHGSAALDVLSGAILTTAAGGDDRRDDVALLLARSTATTITTAAPNRA